MSNEQKRNPDERRQYIFFLVKFFAKQEYANDFVSGRLYANQLSFFKKIEDVGDTNRGDKNEGTVMWGQPGRIQIEINGHNMSNDLAGPVSVSLNRLYQFNVVCLYAGNIRSYSPPMSMAEIRNQLLIPRECEEFGQYAVVIKNGLEFLNRVKKAANVNNYRVAHGLVRYYNPDTFHGDFPGVSGAFMKQDTYRYQREYRIVIETGSTGTCPIVLDIGDIGDITMHSNIREINQNLQIEIKGGTSC